MGIWASHLIDLEDRGLFSAQPCAVLDIGSSNLYAKGQEEILALLTRRFPALEPKHHALSKKLSDGAGYDPVHGGANGAFAGELLEAMGCSYLAFDIADGYRTHIFDLNTQALPKERQGAFDVVLNFGTTEHLLNQMNAFKVIHEATRAGGFMVHQLPSVGFVNHGYITYTGRFFFDLAGYNNYDLVDFWFTSSPGTAGNLLSTLRDYQTYFPVLSQTLASLKADGHEQGLPSLAIPDICMNLIFRKRTAAPYCGPLETSTSVGMIPHADEGQPRIRRMARRIARRLWPSKPI